MENSKSLTTAEATEKIKNAYRQLIAREDPRLRQDACCALDALNYASFAPPHDELTAMAVEALGCLPAEAGAIMNGFDRSHCYYGSGYIAFDSEGKAHPEWAEVGRTLSIWVKAGYPVEAQELEEASGGPS